MRAVGQKTFKPRFQFRHGVRFGDAKGIESGQPRFLGKRGFDRSTLVQKSRST
jgi:hypothetical protein